jgi:hypothetical protein
VLYHHGNRIRFERGDWGSRYYTDHEDAGKHKGEIAMEIRPFQTSLVDTFDW